MERVRERNNVCIFALEKKKGLALSTHLGVVLRYLRLNCGATNEADEDDENEEEGEEDDDDVGLTLFYTSTCFGACVWHT